MACMGYEQPIVADDLVEGPVRHKLTVDEFLILDEAGVFPSKHVELIDGEIFVLSPIFMPHARTLHMVAVEFELALRRVSSALLCFSPVSALIDEHSLPQADLLVAVSDGGDGFMAPENVRIAVEVASSSLRHDLGTKAELYARAGLPEYWVFDVHGRRIVRMHEIVAGEYSERAEFAFGEQIASATIDRLVVDTTSF